MLTLTIKSDTDNIHVYNLSNYKIEIIDNRSCLLKFYTINDECICYRVSIDERNKDLDATINLMTNAINKNISNTNQITIREYLDRHYIFINDPDRYELQFTSQKIQDTTK